MLMPVAAGSLVTICVARDVFALCDRRAARRRLCTPTASMDVAPTVEAVATLDDECADLLDDIARGLRNHDGLFESVSMAVHHRPHLGRWLSPVILAARDTGRFATVTATDSPPPVRTAIQRLVLAGAHGGASLAVLESGSRDLRARSQVRARARTASAAMRSSVAVLSWLPVVMAGTSVLVSPGTALEVASHGSSAAAVAAGFALNFGGRIWMRRIVSAACS